ncbi:hypothetical protein OSTOST_02386 [Ostertagia ostertagi]
MRLEGSEFPERPKADPALPPEMLRYVKGLRLHEGILPVLYRAKSLFGQGARLESVHMEVPLPERIDLHTITLDQFAVNVLTEKRHADIFHLLIGDFVWVYSLTPSKKFLKEGVPYPETIEQACTILFHSCPTEVMPFLESLYGTTVGTITACIAETTDTKLHTALWSIPDINTYPTLAQFQVPVQGKTGWTVGQYVEAWSAARAILAGDFDLSGRSTNQRKSITATVAGDKVELNNNQVNALNKFHKAYPVLIIDSAYGAGKSLCTALMAIEAVQRGKVVLIAAVQNTADVICAKLAQMETPDVRPVRYVSETLARDAIRSGLYDLASLMEHMPQTHAEKMDDYEKNAFSASADPRRRLRESIFSGVERTLMASEHKTLLPLEQANSERIRTLMTRFPDATYTLVGDSNQLPPYIGTQRAPLAVTLFSQSVLDVARRVGNPPTCKISTVYRPHPNMMELNPRIFYNGELVCGTTKEARLALLNRVWMLNPDLPIAFINIIGESVQSVTGSQNPVEARQLPSSFDSF